MKKSSLKTFLAGKNPYSSCAGQKWGTTAKLVGSTSIMLACDNPDLLISETVQYIDGFEDPWYCDVLDDGIAVTYFAYDQ